MYTNRNYEVYVYHFISLKMCWVFSFLFFYSFSFSVVDCSWKYDNGLLVCLCTRNLEFWNFVLFNDAWSQKGHSASNTTVILASSSLLRHIIITFAITFSHLFLLLIFYTFLYKFISLRKERTWA